MEGQNMLERVTAFIEQHQLLPEEGQIIVAVSGGTDSLCLLHLLNRLCGPARRYPGVTLHAAHLDHMLRGEESTQDAAEVERLVASWGIPITIGRVDVIALARTEKRSLEEAARLARYAFLRELAQGRRIAVAHHADDQVETLLLHWLRGSGLAGLVGMPPRQQDIIRPLLAVTRAETAEYCRAQQIVPLEDHSNADPRFLRNRIRHEVVPLLKELNPGIQSTLLRNAEVVRVDLEWLEVQVDHSWERVVVSESADAIRLRTDALLTLSLSLQRHLLRRASAQLCAGQSPLELRHYLLIEQLLANQTDRQERELHLPEGLRILHQGKILILERMPAYTESQSEPAEALLPIPGRAHIPGTPWQAQAELVPAVLLAEISTALSQENWSAVWQALAPVTPHAVYIDAATLGSQILVRTRRPGDRIRPLGMSAEKKVQDIFTDQHIPRSQRDTIPLFFSDAHCLWIAGCCIDDRVRLTSRSRRIVRLEVQAD
jgi:tRNA(Ile)-lysidine synthase